MHVTCQYERISYRRSIQDVCENHLSTWPKSLWAFLELARPGSPSNNLHRTPMPAPKSEILRFTSHRDLRQRLLLSILSGKSVRVDQIRSEDIQVGLRDYEVNLLRLVEKVTNGSTIEISVTGEQESTMQADVFRYILFVSSWSTPRWFLLPHMPCRSISRVLP